MTPRAQYLAECLADPEWAAIVEEACALLDDTRATDAAMVAAIDTVRYRCEECRGSGMSFLVTAELHVIPGECTGCGGMGYVEG